MLCTVATHKRTAKVQWKQMKKELQLQELGVNGFNYYVLRLWGISVVMVLVLLDFILL
jgi:hypothetical protein